MLLLVAVSYTHLYVGHSNNGVKLQHFFSAEWKCMLYENTVNDCSAFKGEKFIDIVLQLVLLLIEIKRNAQLIISFLF